MHGATHAVPHTPSWPGAYLSTQTTYICEKQKVNNFRTFKLSHYLIAADIMPVPKCQHGFVKRCTHIYMYSIIKKKRF